MTQTDYEQKKQECWEEYFKHVVCGTDSHEYWFNKIFDRAYALGKLQASCEQVKEGISQEEIEVAAKEYAAEVDKNVRDLYGIENLPVSLTFGECAAESFREGVKFALGKQDKDADTVISGWVARDCDGDVFLYQNEPDRNEIAWNGYMMHSLPIDSFLDLTWDSDPLPVEITLKRKKNGRT